ncbi:hypothetical protein GN244_ATG20661 [Phytophthora infestans]|uniref:Uncharacterized protein n=1 Tax=Phytophthora infestans TaxID=4787 RepID=A0A833S1T2_PHYIN|nr:hypothetical protein GN244_ATG20661 [Phytophthora infestans]
MIFPQLLPLQTPLLKDQCLAMPLDTDDMLEIPDDDNDSASLASYDSEEFGLIAGKGFARMAEHVNVVEVARQKAAIPSAMRRTSSLWNRFLLDDELIKMGGLISKRKGLFSKHYFYGSIEMPEDSQVREEDQSQSENFFESISRRHEGGVDLRDPAITAVTSHSLTEVDDVVDLTSGKRDAVYQMRELATRELPWLAEATEKNIPAFFELQTHPTTNNALADAGVRLVVMKLVMRGVLLDIIYSRDSYFATLRDNTEEIALEDTLVPDAANAGPCYLLDTVNLPRRRKFLVDGMQSKEDESGDIVDDAVVFQFNQFGYHGSAQLPTRMLDDSGDLVSRGFPMLRAQASEVAFAGVSQVALLLFIDYFKKKSDLDLLIGAQKWVHSFMREAPIASGGNELITTHLARWIEIEDGSETFFELELARGSLCPFTQAVGEDQALNLMVWKGIVHDALLGVIYRRGSLLMTLKPVLESSDLDDDAPD